MRPIIKVASLSLLAMPLLSLSLTPAAAQGNDLMGQVQKLFNNDSNSTSDRDAYERGRQDEQRRQQTQRDERRWQRDQRDVTRYDRERDNRYRDPAYDYNTRN